MTIDIYIYIYNPHITFGIEFEHFGMNKMLALKFEAFAPTYINR